MDKQSNQALMHFGIKGMKWGVRRYQNEDRTLTEAGKKRYGKDNKTSDRKYSHDLNKIDRESQVSKSRAETLRGYALDREIREKRKMKKSGKEFSERAARKIEKYSSKAAEYDKLSKEGRDFIDQIITSATNSGKSIKMRDVWRYSGYDYGREKYIPGRHYNVKSDGGKNSSYKRSIDPNNRMYVTRYYYWV